MRKFGIEIECVMPRTMTMTQLRELIRAAGVQVETTNYSDRVYRAGVWKIKPDMSIEGNGAEVVSPPITDLSSVEIVCSVLNAAGITVNKSCGFHVHFDMSDMPAWQVADVALRWNALGADIHTLLPSSRRPTGEKYRWCRMMTATEVDALTRMVKTKATTLAIGAAPERYRALNLTNYSRLRTVEFRQGAGTTSYEKISNWVRFIESFIADTRAKRAATLVPTVVAAPAAPVADAPRGGPTFNRFVAMLRDGNPVDLEGARIALGLQTPQLINRILRQLRVEHGWNIAVARSGRQFVSARRVLPGSAPIAANEVPVLDAGSMTDGVPADVAAWLTRRAAELASDTTA